MQRTLRQDAAACLFLALLTLAVFYGILGNDFISYDDPQYVTDNARVLSGLSLENLVWAFTTGHAANWHPVTWISHQLDAQLFGTEPWGHHLVSLLLHGANACLLFLALSRMTGARWLSLLVAALFAVHPLHVESVAWVAERKDVLSSFFGLCALICYLRFVEKRTAGRYLLVLATFALALMSKPMLVTLPLVLLLLDFWPLGRLAGGVEGAAGLSLERLPAGRLVLEKLPLLLLSALSSVVTVIVQAKGEAVHTLEATPLALRLANACASYLRYLGKLVWPADLSVLYPMPREIPTLAALAGALLVLAVSWAALRYARRAPWLAVGWFWFLGTLVPVIGLVQVGLQSMADRYLYFPMIGVLLAAVWGGAELVARRPALKTPFVGVAALALLGYGAVTWSYQGSWKDSTTLFSHAIESTGENYYLHYLLGTSLYRQERYQDALAQFALAIRQEPKLADAYLNAGIIHAKQGNLDEAARNFNAALALKPESPYVQYNLAVSLQKMGRTAEAARHYQEVLRIDPARPEAHSNLGLILMEQGNYREAAGHFEEALRLRPDLEQARALLQECQQKMAGR